MKLALLAGFLLFGVLHQARAETLAIGGIELRLGQKIEEALTSLSFYDVRHIGDDSWLVNEKIETPDGTLFIPLGSIRAKSNLVIFIGKEFKVRHNEDSGEIYAHALKETHLLGGKNCSTHEQWLANGSFSGFKTECGNYEVTYTMPSWFGKRSVWAGVSISTPANFRF